MTEKAIEEKLETREWYRALIEECKAIITESSFTSRWALVEGYHLLGKRILQENDNFKRVKIYGKEITTHVSQSLGRSKRTVERAIQFVKKYPSLKDLPEGKNVTWHRICNKYLPVPKEESVKIPLPKGKFNVIYADPPWRYEFSETKSRQIESKYPTLPLKAIKEIEVPSSEDSVLFLWATAPKLEEALDVMRAWGFTYRTCAIWDKEVIGMGYWFRIQHELLLVGRKGKMSAPDPENRISSVFREKRGKHSQKPGFIYGIIEKMYPDGEYLELFARGKRNGWTSWGDEA